MGSKQKRQRELERERRHRQEQRRAEAERRRQRRLRIIVALVVAALVLTMAVGVIASLSSPPDDAVARTQDQSAAAPATGEDSQCAYVDSVADPSLVTDVGRPDPNPGEVGDATATLTLGGRDVTISLDGSAAPCTVNSWAFLADADYFDDTVCHRLTTSPTLGVLQCGDPSGTGAGGPGYTLGEENLTGATYPAGTVAMANTGQPGTTSSQFFIVHSDSQLPPLYTVVGSVTDGLDVVTDIAAAGTVDSSTDGEPAADARLADLVVERSNG
jgi:peptidyl-prolyl cis-trans isomerase B (cyclophilin B)